MEIGRDHKLTEKALGRIIAHGPDRAALVEPFQQFAATHHGKRAYQFFTGELFPSDVVVVL